jgi:hypothetical protein
MFQEAPDAIVFVLIVNGQDIMIVFEDGFHR